MYNIRHAGAKGLGVFATKLIPRGTRILAEKPLFSVNSERDLFAATRKLVAEDKEFLKGLSVNENAAASTLQEWVRIMWHVARGSWTMTVEPGSGHSRWPGLTTVQEYQALRAAFRNNNFDIGDKTQAVFKEISRLNHACIPNTQGNFNTNLGAFTIHSLRPIEPDEEITLSYIETYATTRRQRQNSLRAGYGFECGCAACDMSRKRARDGERRRVVLRERLERMYAWQKEGGGKRDLVSELELLKEMIGTFEAEGLAGRELGTM
jgi:hypothetical protein